MNGTWSGVKEDKHLQPRTQDFQLIRLPEVGIYKRNQESKKTRKNALDQESYREKRRKKRRKKTRNTPQFCDFSKVGLGRTFDYQK